jgi:hypothetical protein
MERTAFSFYYLIKNVCVVYILCQRRDRAPGRGRPNVGLLKVVFTRRVWLKEVGILQGQEVQVFKEAQCQVKK